MRRKPPIQAPVHVLWLGGEPSPENAGMDTVAVDLLRRKHPDQEVIFYCLDSERERYQAYFDEREPSDPQVQVRGIESYVESLGKIEHPFQSPDYPNDLAAAFREHIDHIKKRVAGLKEPRDKIREWVGLKELLTYFLQIKEEGFFIDSNVTPSGVSIKFARSFRASQMYNPEIKEIQWDPYIVLSIRAKDASEAIMESEDSKRRFLHNLVASKKYLKLCEDEDGSILSQTATIVKSLPQDRQGKQPTVRLMIATLFVDGVAAEARGIRMHFPEDVSSLCGLSMSTSGFNKRFSNTHTEDSYLQALPLTHRILLGPRQTEELCYYLEKRPHEDIFISHQYPDELAIEERQDFSLVERAKCLGDYDRLGNMLAYSQNSQVIQELKEAPRNSNCLTHYLEETCWRFHLQTHHEYHGADLALLINHLTTSIGLDNANYGSMEDIIADFYDNPLLQQAIQIICEQGPLHTENIEDYVQALKKASTQEAVDESAIQEALAEHLSVSDIGSSYIP
jgi:hypothetical protein